MFSSLLHSLRRTAERHVNTAIAAASNDDESSMETAGPTASIATRIVLARLLPSIS